MYDPQFFQSSASAWPNRYQNHADALLRLAAASKARAKSILLDITFGQARDAPTITPLGHLLQRFLEHMPVGGVGASSIAPQQETMGVGALRPAMLDPPVRDAVAAELAGVHAGIEVQASLVACHVI